MSERDPNPDGARRELDNDPLPFCACCCQPYKYTAEQLRQFWEHGTKIRCGECRRRCPPKGLCVV